MDAHPFRALRKAHALWQAGGWATRGLAIMVLTDEHRRLDQRGRKKNTRNNESAEMSSRQRGRQSVWTAVLNWVAGTAFRRPTWLKIKISDGQHTHTHATRARARTHTQTNTVESHTPHLSHTHLTRARTRAWFLRSAPDTQGTKLHAVTKYTTCYSCRSTSLRVHSLAELQQHLLDGRQSLPRQTGCACA